MSFPAFITSGPLFRGTLAVVDIKDLEYLYAAEPAFGTRFLKERS
jgi:hypothetical protein